MKMRQTLMALTKLKSVQAFMMRKIRPIYKTGLLLKTNMIFLSLINRNCNFKQSKKD